MMKRARPRTQIQSTEEKESLVLLKGWIELGEKETEKREGLPDADSEVEEECDREETLSRR